MWRGVLTGALVAATLVAVYLVGFSLRFDANVSALLPARGEAAALRQYLRAFGGSDLSLVLIEGEGLGSAGAELAAALEAEDAVEQATAGLSPRTGVPVSFLWRHADASARERLGRALTEPGMRERLRTSRAMLLAPGGSAAAESLPSDPLRLAQLFADHPYRTGFQVQPDGSFANDEGTAQLVLVFPRGQSLRSDDAKAFVGQAEAVLAKFRARYPDLRFRLTGGHAIGAQTERMLRRDLTWSSSLSMFLASIAFLFTFRRLRALVAVMPPLALGTLWTTAAAAAFPEGLSGIAIAFMSVVIGVGVDTGVHVYAALLEARAEGMTPREAAVEARRRAARPTLVAAGTAGFAFGALALSDIAALRQLGILCAVGEVVTAVAIVLVTPEIGAWLERDEVRARPAGWTRHVAALTQTRARALIVALVVATPLLALALGLRPAVADAIVAVRPQGLEALDVQRDIQAIFGGETGHWLVVVSDVDPEVARERTDRITEALSERPENLAVLDSPSMLVPAAATQRARLAAREALGPLRSRLEEALTDTGFAPDRFTEALNALDAKPSLVTVEELRADRQSQLLLRRYLGRDGPQTVVVTYVVPKRGRERAVEAIVAASDPRAAITGYGRLDQSLRRTLAEELPRVGAVAAVLVLLSLAFALRRARDVVVAGLVVGAEIALVLALLGATDIPLHIYDALVLPVLLGITVDEVMFLLFRARRASIEETLEREGPPVATTALTTAAGFAGLLICDFDGLRHLGAVGALGSAGGLVMALLLVPATLRLASRAG